MTRAFIGLGSNLDEPETRLKAAENALCAVQGIHMRAASPVYATEPQGLKNQPWFCNQVLALDCEAGMTAPDLATLLIALEKKLGRDGKSEVRFGPRRIDLDLLLFGNEVRTNVDLILPHPRIFERAFVLVPLHDIAPDLVFPDGSELRARLAALDYHTDGRYIYQKGVFKKSSSDSST